MPNSDVIHCSKTQNWRVKSSILDWQQFSAWINKESVFLLGSWVVWIIHMFYCWCNLPWLWSLCIFRRWWLLLEVVFLTKLLNAASVDIVIFAIERASRNGKHAFSKLEVSETWDILIHYGQARLIESVISKASIYTRKNVHVHSVNLTLMELKWTSFSEAVLNLLRI